MTPKGRPNMKRVDTPMPIAKRGREFDVGGFEDVGALRFEKKRKLNG